MDGFLWEKLGMSLEERVGRELYYMKFMTEKFFSVNSHFTWLA